MVGKITPIRNFTNYLDGWQEYSFRKPLPPARIIDDYFALKKCGLSDWKTINLLSEFHATIPAKIWVQVHELFATREETSPMLFVVRFHPPELTGFNNRLWRLADSFLSYIAIREDRIRHKTKTPPGW